MEDEVFEKYLEKLIEEFYPFGAEYYDPDKIEEKEKIQVRKILEEVEHKNYAEGYEACEEDNAERG